jgi:glycosyltransferase involved in cell wall biosynthesis
MFDLITPLILTYNEAPNIGRVLDRLAWARRVVVVDSCSDDATESIAKGYPNVSLVRRPFDCHANQWGYGLRETGIDTEWVLAMDADYIAPDELLREIRTLAPGADVSGYRASFKYCIEGRPLRATVYTPVTVLYRRERAVYIQDGHTQRVTVDGTIASLSTNMLHDDRKSLSRWVASQDRYMWLEAEKLLAADWSSLGWPGRVRKLRVIAPFAMLIHCLFVKGLILDGRAGVFYSFQRACAELLLSLHLLQHDLSAGSKS